MTVEPSKTKPEHSPSRPGPRDGQRPSEPRKSLKMVQRRRATGRVARTILLLLAVFIGVLFLPWQQTIKGGGEVIVYKASDRPQTIQAQISARLEKLEVQEGMKVEKGQVIAVLNDIDSKFLDPRQQMLLTRQVTALEQSQSEAEGRAAALRRQQSEIVTSQDQQLQIAARQIQQAINRRDGVKARLQQAEQRLRAVREVEIGQADQRLLQARDGVDQAQQQLDQALQNEKAMRLRFERTKRLEAKGLESTQRLELDENDAIGATKTREQRERSLEISKANLKVATLQRKNIDIAVLQQAGAVEDVKQQLLVAETDIDNARLARQRILAETNAQLNGIGASIQSALESVAKNSSDIQKASVELGNVTQRTGQQIVRAPVSGQIIRVTKVGMGETVKAGDEICSIAPKTGDRMVELMIRDNDLPFIAVGRPVRLQIAGWPAIQFPGMPGVAAGTFGGRIAFIDAVDDGTARFRILVKEDRQKLPGGRVDEPWPDPELLKPGMEAIGWVVLDFVPVWFELWRQFNAFGPLVPQDNLGSKTKSEKGSSIPDVGKSEKRDKDKNLGTIEFKAK